MFKEPVDIIFVFNLVHVLLSGFVEENVDTFDFVTLGFDVPR